MADKKIELRCHLYTQPSATSGMPVVESPDEGIPAGSVVSVPAEQADRLIKLGLAKEVGEAPEVSIAPPPKLRTDGKDPAHG